MSFFDNRANRLDYFAQMRDRLSIDHAMHPLIEPANAGAKSQHHPSTANAIEIECAECGFHRTAGEGQRDTSADFKIPARHRGGRQSRERGTMQLRRPHSINSRVLE